VVVACFKVTYQSSPVKTWDLMITDLVAKI
jgi:hypothetical protein